MHSCSLILFSDVSIFDYFRRFDLIALHAHTLYGGIDCISVSLNCRTFSTSLSLLKSFISFSVGINTIPTKTPHTQTTFSSSSLQAPSLPTFSRRHRLCLAFQAAHHGCHGLEGTLWEVNGSQGTGM